APGIEQPLEPLFAVVAAEQPVVVANGNPQFTVLPDGRVTHPIVLAGQLTEGLAGTCLRRLQPGAMVGEPDRIVLALLRFAAIGVGPGPGVIDPAVGAAFLPSYLTVGLDPVAVIVRLVVEVGVVGPAGVLRYEEHLFPTADGLVVVVLARSEEHTSELQSRE